MRRPRCIASTEPTTHPTHRSALDSLVRPARMTYDYPPGNINSMTDTPDAIHTRRPLVRKDFILVLLATLVAAFTLFYVSFDRGFRRSFRRLLPSVREYDTAMGGALGQALFESPTGLLPSRPGDPGSDLATLAIASISSPADKERLIRAYRHDPEKFKRYAAMGHTATNGFLIGGWLLSRRITSPPPDSTSLQLPSHMKVDAWGRPLCILTLRGSGLAVISGGPGPIPPHPPPARPAPPHTFSPAVFH